MAVATPKVKAKTFPPLITGSTWTNAYQACWDRAKAANGVTTNDKDTIGPRITNAEAVALIAAWHEIAGATMFALWYQFAAVAYGWDPTSKDELDTSAEQGARAYLPAEVTVELWLALYGLATDLDEGKTRSRLDMSTVFADPVFMGSVRAELQGDGAEAQWKIPTGLCIDKKTGKRRPMTRPKCGKDGRYVDPITGIERPCSNPGDCTPETIDDPITKVGKDVFTLALIVGAVWWFSRNTRRQRRNR